MPASDIFSKIQGMRTVVTDVLNKLNNQINWFAAKDGDETFFTMSGARISAKPFVIGFIPPENPVDFIATESVVEPTSGMGKIDPGPAKQVPKEQKTFTPKDLRKAHFDGYERKFGKKPSEETVCFLSAQSTLEIGGGANLGRSKISAPNFNVGGVHASQDGGVLSDPCSNSLSSGVTTSPTPPGAGKYFLGVDKEVNQDKCSKFNGSDCPNGCFFPVHFKSYDSLTDATTDQVNYVDKFPGATDAKTPEDYVNSLCPAISKGSGDCYFSANQESFDKYLNGIKNGCEQYKKTFQVELGEQPNEESAIITPAEQNLNKSTVATRTSYAIETNLENEDGIFNYGRNIKISEQRQKNIQPQLAAIKQQIDFIQKMPPLVLLINPDESSRSYEKSIDDSNKGRQKNIVHMWLERPLTISSSGQTAAQYVLNADNTGGITHRNRIHSLSYLNLMSLVSIYKNNGQVYTGPSSGFGENIGIPVISMSIFIYYDHHLYIGSFDDFEISDSGDKPFNLSYSFKFTVRYDASALLAAGAKLGSATPSEIRNNIFIQGTQLGVPNPVPDEGL